MSGRIVFVFPWLVLGLSAPAPAQAPEQSRGSDMRRWAELCSDWDDWDKPGPPFQVFGNTFYVGTCGITAILITGSEGHILIDGGTEQGAEIIAGNIEALGFKLSDVKILLMSHEHHDHVGGLAKLQQMTGARLLASPAAAVAMSTGRASVDDPQFAMHEPFSPARVDEILGGDMVVKLGNLSVQGIATPGHTPGAMSWQWESLGGLDFGTTIVYADSLSPVSSDTYRFSDHPAYTQAFRESIAKIAALECRPILTPHPSASNMRARILGQEVTRTPCADYAAGLEVRLDERLFKEAGPE